MSVIFCTLGPEGTCHDNAVKNFIQFQKIKNTKIIYTDNFFSAAEELSEEKIDYLVQNSAHPDVALLGPKFRDKIYIVDSFVSPTKIMGILKNKISRANFKLGLMPATIGYINPEDWTELIYEKSNPYVLMGMLAGKYDYGVTFIEYAQQYPEYLEVMEDFGGAIDSAWIVYAKKKRDYGDIAVFGVCEPNFYNHRRKNAKNNHQRN